MKYIHELKMADLRQILRDGSWQTYQQSVTSSETNTNAEPELNEQQIAIGENTSGIEAYSDIIFDANVDTVLDVGGGRFDVCKNYLAKKGIDLLVWDPYNRSLEHNSKIKEMVTVKQLKAATSMSVLNVIPEVEVRLAHICTVKDALQLDGKAYFKVWPGDGDLKASCIPSSDSSSYQANASRERFLIEIQAVFGAQNVRLHPHVPNLILAIKKYHEITPVNVITLLQTRSKQATKWYGFQAEKASIRYSEKILATSMLFFTSSLKKYLTGQRHQSADAQQAYDKQFGLVKR